MNTELEKLMLNGIVAAAKEGHRVIALSERRRIVARIQALTVDAAHDPEALFAANDQAVYLLLVNSGISAGYRAAIRAIEAMGEGEK